MPISKENKKLYPPDWQEIRGYILQRADNKCERCDARNGSVILRGEWNEQPAYQDDDGNIWHEETGKWLGDGYVGDVCPNQPNKQAIKVVLTIAHLDHNPQNNDKKNLKALCQLHHLRHDIEHPGKAGRKTNSKNNLNYFKTNHENRKT